MLGSDTVHPIITEIVTTVSIIHCKQIQYVFKTRFEMHHYVFKVI